MSKSFSRARLAFVLLVAVASAACGRLRLGGDPDRATLNFANESLDQASVYAVVSGSESIRLGTVLPGRTEQLVVPSNITKRGESVNIVVRLLARSDTPQTGPISIRPGDELDVRLAVDGRMLTVVPAR